MKKQHVAILLILMLVSVFFSFSQTNLVAHYPFNGTANDTGSNAWHGVNHLAVPDSDRLGNPGMSYYFDGTSSYITLGSSFDYAEKSVSVWFNALEIPTGDVVIVGVDNGSLVNGHYGLDVRNSDKLRASCGNQSAMTVISANIWYHAVLVINSSTFLLYLNGDVKSTGSTSTYHSINGESNMRVGINRLGSGAFFHGKIDDIRIFDKALSSIEVTDLYNRYNGIGEMTGRVKIYPNPASDEISISGLSDQTYTYTIFDRQGKEIQSGICQQKIDLASYRPGLYLLRISNQDGKVVISERILKE